MYKCAKDCLMNRKCKTISIHATKKRCKLHDRNSTDPGMALVPADGWVLYETNWNHKKVDDFLCTFTVYEKYFQAKVHISIFCAAQPALSLRNNLLRDNEIRSKRFFATV